MRSGAEQASPCAMTVFAPCASHIRTHLPARPHSVRACRPGPSLTGPREVRSCRGGAIRSYPLVQLPMVQSPTGHILRRFRYTSRLGGPWRGSSTSSTRVRVLHLGGQPHDGQSIDRSLVSTWTLSTPPGPSSMPWGQMSGSPITQTSARRVNHHGGPPSSDFEQPKAAKTPFRSEVLPIDKVVHCCKSENR